jgi:hypothetical protein
MPVHDSSCTSNKQTIQHNLLQKGTEMMYAQDAVRSPVDRLLQVGVVEDDVRALTAKLQRHVLQVALRGALHDLAADEGAPGERDLVDLHVLADGLSDDVAVACEDVDDTRGKAGFLNECSHSDGAQGCEFGRLNWKIQH